MHLCCHRRECCSNWASENEFPWFNRYFTEMNSVCKYYNIQFFKIQLSYQDSYLLSLQFWDCYVSGTWRVVLCRDPWTPVIAGVIRGDTRAAFALIAGVVRGEISPAWVYVLRASLKPNFLLISGILWVLYLLRREGWADRSILWHWHPLW